MLPVYRVSLFWPNFVHNWSLVKKLNVPFQNARKRKVAHNMQMPGPKRCSDKGVSLGLVVLTRVNSQLQQGSVGVQQHNFYTKRNDVKNWFRTEVHVFVFAQFTLQMRPLGMYCGALLSSSCPVPPPPDALPRPCGAAFVPPIKWHNSQPQWLCGKHVWCVTEIKQLCFHLYGATSQISLHMQLCKYMRTGTVDYHHQRVTVTVRSITHPANGNLKTIPIYTMFDGSGFHPLWWLGIEMQKWEGVLR